MNSTKLTEWQKDGAKGFYFPEMPLIMPINRYALELGRAFINIREFSFGAYGKILTVPALFISDGMSTPPPFDAFIEPIEGIAQGHIHDYGYSCQCSWFEGFDKAEARKMVDTIMHHYLLEHSPGYNKAEADGAYVGVRFGGKGSFRDRSRDEWRKRISERAGGIDEDGCGVLAKTGDDDIVEIANQLQYGQTN